LRNSAGAGFGGLLLATLDPTTVDPVDESVGEVNTPPPFVRERNLSSGSSSIVSFMIGGLMFMISRSLGPNILNLFFFIQGVRLGLMVIRPAFARSKKCVMQMIDPAANSMNSAARDDVKLASKEPVIACTQNGKMTM
jgi:hypothetical protein